MPVANRQLRIDDSRQIAKAKIRKAIVGDVDGIIAVEHASFTTAAEIFNRRQVRSLISNPRATAFVAEFDRPAGGAPRGQIAGWAVALIRRHRGGATGRLYALAVHPGARGAKIGKALLWAMLADLKAWGAGRAYLEVRSDNQTAIGLYRAAGFAEHKRLPDYYGHGRHGLSMVKLFA